MNAIDEAKFHAARANRQFAAQPRRTGVMPEDRRYRRWAYLAALLAAAIVAKICGVAPENEAQKRAKRMLVRRGVDVVLLAAWLWMVVDMISRWTR